MRKIAALTTLVGALTLSFPAYAMAAIAPMPFDNTATQVPLVPSTLQWIMSIVGLVVAVFGLYLISQINNLTKGGAISGRASYIIVAFMLLGISSILNVAVFSFRIQINYDFLAHINEALKIVAMGFFVLYFQRVLAGLRGYMDLGAAEQSFIDDASAASNSGDAGAE